MVMRKERWRTFCMCMCICYLLNIKLYCIDQSSVFGLDWIGLEPGKRARINSLCCVSSIGSKANQFIHNPIIV